MTFKTGGADFAEALSQMDPGEKILPGDVVGIYKGKVSLNTKEADQIMVLSDRPAILGNAPYDDESANTPNVSFIGQILVRVIGPVRSGDWLVQSGLGDGRARVLDPIEITVQDQIIGQAWETNLKAGEKLINTAIGIGKEQVLFETVTGFKSAFQKQQAQIEKQQIEINQLKKQMTVLLEQLSK